MLSGNQPLWCYGLLRLMIWLAAVFGVFFGPFKMRLRGRCAYIPVTAPGRWGCAVGRTVIGEELAVDDADMRNETLKRARRACHMASMGMSWLSVLCGLGLAFVLLIAAQDLCDGSGAGAYWVVQTLSFAIIVCIPAILVRFFRDFARDPLPFGRQQSRRLLVAGILVLIQIVLGLVSPPAPAATISLAGLPLIYSARDGHFIDAGHVVEAVFFLCLSAVFRYGEALQEDSDNIL